MQTIRPFNFNTTQCTVDRCRTPVAAQQPTNTSPASLTHFAGSVDSRPLVRPL